MNPLEFWGGNIEIETCDIQFSMDININEKKKISCSKVEEMVNTF